jgi:hypothetical protein
MSDICMFDKIDKFIFEIYTIGYKNQGESILVLIKANNMIVMSCVIACAG